MIYKVYYYYLGSLNYLIVHCLAILMFSSHYFFNWLKVWLVKEYLRVSCWIFFLFVFFFFSKTILGASLVDQIVKNPPAVEETRVQFLGWEDTLEKGMFTHSSIFPWRIPWTEEPGGLQFVGSQRVRHS